MSIENLRFRPSFQAKIIVSVVTLLILLPAITLIFVHRSSMEALSNESRKALTTADALFQNSLSLRSRQLIARYKSTAGESSFQAVSGTGDAKTIRTDLNERLADLKFGEEAEVALFFTPEGKPLASASRDPQIRSSELERALAPYVEQALAGQPVSVVLPLDSAIYDVVAVPAFSMQRPTGVLVVGVRITLSMLHELTALVNGEGVLLANHNIAASTLRSPVPVETLPYWPADPRAMPAIQRIEIEHAHYVAIASRMRGAGNDNEVGYVLLISYETALQQLRRTEATLWLLSLVGIMISTAVIWVVIRKITAPLRELRLNAEAIGAGDFTRKIQVRSTDEIGQLTHAFNQMTRNLRASHNELQSTVETLKATQAQLIQSEKLSAVGEFVSGVAHELNNPLTAVIGFGEMLGQANLEPKYRAFLNYIVRSTERCHKIVHGLLSFARQHPPERKVLQVNQLVDDVVELLAYEMRTSNIEVQRNFHAPLPSIIGDSHQLQQVILNILNNARQAIEGHQSSGKIQITTHAVADTVRITIEDNGPGISQENLAKIFNPFFTTKPVGKGTGLGLSLCYGIIREHGGSITAQSATGKGATFVIDLPGHKQPKENQSNSGRLGTLSLDGAGKRALVIDDEEWILELVRQILNRDGFEVDVAIDGNVALDRISRGRYELLVCDWKMPGLSGPQLFDRINALSPEAANHLIFMTGDVVSDSIQQFLHTHSKRCLSKPFSVDEFRQTIGDFIAGRN